jgi:hypothetical protein
MPFQEVNLVPSVNVESTKADNPTGISASNFIRWMGNLPQKRGGCTLLVDKQLPGVPRELQPWGDVRGNKLLAIATTENVWGYDASYSGSFTVGWANTNSYLSPWSNQNNVVSPWSGKSGSIFTPNPMDMSPQLIGQPLGTNYTPRNVPIYNPDGTTLSKPVLKTEAGSSLVQVYDSLATPGNRVILTVYDSVTFNTPVSIGGLVLQGTYPIVVGGGVTSYYIDAGSKATETTSTTEQVHPYIPRFSTISGSSAITVTFPTEYQFGSLRPGDRVGFFPSTEVGGITVGGQYLVQSIATNGTQFTVIGSKAATSNQTLYMNSGQISLTYWITKGPAIAGAGYGVNGYGTGPYGQGASLTPVSGQTYKSNDWYLDNRGEALIACAVGGPIFYWFPDSGYTNLSVQYGAPVVNQGAFVAMPFGHIMSWGCSTPINPYPDPLFIRWSSNADPNVWSISALNGNNDAGFFSIPTGSKIIRGIQGQVQQFWFTDIDLYVAQYVGYPNVYSFNKIGNGCGLIAPKAVVLSGSNIYWMSQTQFFAVAGTGTPQAIQCSAWDFIFQNMNMGIDPVSGKPYPEQVVAAANSNFNEVIWYFTTNQTDALGKFKIGYICFNTAYQEWDYGYLDRTAWYDQSIIGQPIGADSNGFVYQHETSNDLAVGFTTQPMNAWLETGYFSITQGQDLSFVDWVLPDFKWGFFDTYYTNPPSNDANLKLTFYVTDYAGQEPKVFGPYPFNKETQYITTRFRGRFISMKVESDDLGSFWRLGSTRYRLAASGRR